MNQKIPHVTEKSWSPKFQRTQESYQKRTKMLVFTFALFINILCAQQPTVLMLPQQFSADITGTISITGNPPTTISLTGNVGIDTSLRGLLGVFIGDLDRWMRLVLHFTRINEPKSISLLLAKDLSHGPISLLLLIVLTKRLPFGWKDSLLHLQTRNQLANFKIPYEKSWEECGERDLLILTMWHWLTDEFRSHSLTFLVSSFLKLFQLEKRSLMESLLKYIFFLLIALYFLQSIRCTRDWTNLDWTRR